MTEILRKIKKHGISESFNIVIDKSKKELKRISIKSGKYDFSNNDEVIKNISEKFSKYLNDLEDINTSNFSYRKNNNDCINGIFYLLGKNYCFGDHINWHFNSNDIKKSYPNIYTGDVITADNKKFGDYRITWELNRHHHFIWYAQNYLMTKDETYIARLKYELNDWVSQNKVGYGINFKSPMEISIRIINWIVTMVILYRVGRSDIFFNKDVINNLLGQILYLNDNLFIKDRKLRNNHSIVELAGLIIFKAITDWNRLSSLDNDLYPKLFKELEEQFYEDGVNFEHSPTYSRFTIESLLVVLVLLKQKEFSDNQKRLYDLTKIYVQVLRKFVTPENSVPLFSDSDNGRILFLGGTNKEFNNFRGFFDFCGFYFNNEELFISENKSDINEETKWWCFLSNIEVNSFQKTKKDNLNYFSSSGYWIYNTEKIYFAFKSGYLGNRNLDFEYAPHVHNDLLSYILYINGKPFIVDSGTYTYDISDDNFRNYFRSSAAHSIIIVDKNEQLSHVETFKAINLPKANLVKLDDYTCEGSIELENKIILNRRVKIIKDNKLEFLDSASELSNGMKIETIFNLHPSVKLEIKDSDVYLTNSNVQAKICFNKQDRYEIKTKNGWVSESYNEKKENQKLILSALSNGSEYRNNWEIIIIK
jgi:uncharacterized heparinase superfamily protein